MRISFFSIFLGFFLSIQQVFLVNAFFQPPSQSRFSSQSSSLYPYQVSSQSGSSSFPLTLSSSLSSSCEKDMNTNDVLVSSSKKGGMGKMLSAVFGTMFSLFFSFHSNNDIMQASRMSISFFPSSAGPGIVQVTNAADKASIGNLEGTQAPLFSLPGSTGSSVSLTDLTQTGKYTVLYFYPGDFTSGCTLEANAFQKNLDAIKALNAQVVGVSVDPVDKHVEFRKSCGLDFVLLSDEGGKVSEAYGTALDIPFLGKFSNRQTYLISPNGVVEKVFTNLNGKVSKHPEEVIAALEELKK